MRSSVEDMGSRAVPGNAEVGGLDAVLTEENRALVERIDRFRVPTGDAIHEHVSICASTMNALLNAAREEGCRNATTFPRIATAEVCYGFGWTDGYGSALKGRDGPCMSQAWKDSPARLLVAWRPTHRHVKRGTDYQVIGSASLQAGEPVGEAGILVVYRDVKGRLWARPEAEFDDGRFESLLSPSRSSSPSPTTEGRRANPESHTEEVA